MEFVVKTDNEIHCSTCKHYYCNNASMYCSHPKKCGKITAARKMDVSIGKMELINIINI